MSKRASFLLLLVFGLASCSGAPGNDVDVGVDSGVDALDGDAGALDGDAGALDGDAGALDGDAGALDGGMNSECRFIYRSGHGDLYIRAATDGGLEVLLRTEVVAGEGEALSPPQSVCVMVPRRTFIASQQAGGRPAGPMWDPVGVGAGVPFWFLPQSPLDGVPWFGLATEGVPRAFLVGDAVHLVATGTESPQGGQWSAWENDSFGRPTFLLSTATGLREFERPVGIHQHLNWSFSAPGEWRVAIEATGQRLNGEFLRSAPAMLRFVLLDAP